MTNPKTTKPWQALENQKSDTIKNLYETNPERIKSFNITAADITIDYASTNLTDTIGNELIALANACHLTTKIKDLCQGKNINSTENRPALHTALREQDPNKQNPEVTKTLNRIKTLVESVETQQWRGYSNKPITDIVNLGIGGSDLGPRFIVDALKKYQQKLRCHFVANVDADELFDVLENVNPETTLFIVASKSFTTPETLCNAQTAKQWLLKHTDLVDKHFIAVSANVEKAVEYGIHPDNIFPMWDWVGGRYSLWSAVGLPIAFAIGFEGFKDLLQGAYAMDQHFQTAELNNNIPVILGLIDVWHINFCKINNIAMLPYSHRLKLLPNFLQQLIMESNGKRVDHNNEPVNYQTGAIIWGGEETNAQHAFHQLLFQGTVKVASDIITIENAANTAENHQKLLLANAKAQIKALREGQQPKEIYRHIPGNQPVVHISLPELNPKTLGALVAMYEHRTFVQSAIWNINAFDQWGVELGKVLAKEFE